MQSQYTEQPGCADHAAGFAELEQAVIEHARKIQRQDMADALIELEVIQ